MKWCFYLSIGALITISTGALIKNAVTAEIGDGFLGTEIDNKLAGTLSLRKTGAFVANMGTAEIGDGRAV